MDTSPRASLGALQSSPPFQIHIHCPIHKHTLSCPRSCNCYQANEVHCTFRSLLAIPPGLPAHTRRINLGFNSIRNLHDRSLAGLRRVELLMLHSNDLHHLPDAAFKDMKSLQILKLSYNKLREISSSLTFSGLTSLLRLYLDHNLLQHIHPRALLQLPSLRLLRLQGNRLHQLHPHTLCTLSLLNTYYFSTLRHLDLSNNSLTTLPKEALVTAPLLETLMLQANPWSCDCRMNWFLSWTLAHPGLMKCPGGPQCPLCTSPNSLQGQGLLEQTALTCNSPVIPSPGKEAPLETEPSEIKSSETFREPLGSASLGLSDQQGYSVDLSCNITQSSDSQDIAPPPDLSVSSSSPLPLALSLSLECPVERQSYEKLWRILAYYSETAVRLEREIMLSKSPALAYRYRQAAETDGYYHTGVKASVKARPQWLMQPAISIQLNRAQSNGHKVQLIYSTRVSAHLDPTSHLSSSSAASHPWVLISTNHTTTALAAVAGSKVQLPCPILTSGNPKAQWILPDGSELLSPSSTLDGRLRASGFVLLLQNVQLSDAGIYYCVARAGRDVDVLPLRLAVEESSVPHLGEQVGPPVTGTVGEPVSLPCRMSGSPEPYLSWILPNGKVVRRGTAVPGGLTIETNGSLYLPNPSLRDGGHYRCTAVNHYGRDGLSVQLILNSQHIPALRTSFPRGPQSAAGRSTRIRAPLLRDMNEGSGDGEEVEEATVGNRKRPVSYQGTPNRRYPIGNPRRRGPVREGSRRRGGAAISSTDQRRNLFENKRRVSTSKKKIDPQKWADLLAKIRQKTALANRSQLITTEKPTAAPVQEAEDRVTIEHEEDDDTDRGRGQGAGLEAETEGSSVDDIVLQEEELQPIQPVNTGSQTKTEIKTETETDSEAEQGTERSTEKQIENETDTLRQAEIPASQTQTAANPVTRKEPVTSYPMSGTNEIVPEPVEGDERENPRQRFFPNLVPNARPQRPRNSHRKIGQRRRIISRPRVQLLTPNQRPLEPTNPITPAVTPDTTTNQINMLLLVSTATSAGILSTQRDHIKTAPNDVALNLFDSSSSSSSPSQTPSPSYTNRYTPTAIMTHSGKRPDREEIPDSEESTLFSTPAPTHSNFVISETHVAGTHTLAHSIHKHTETQTALGKHIDTPPNKHSEKLGKNFVSVLYESSSPATHSSLVSSVSNAATAKTITNPTTAPKKVYSNANAGSSKSTSSAMTNEYKLPTTTAINPRTTSSTIFARTIIPTSSTTRHTPSASTSATPIPTSTTPTTISVAEIFTTTINPNNNVFISTTTDTSTTTSSSSNSFIVTPRMLNPPSTATASTTSETTKTTTTTTTTTPTIAVSAKIPSISRAATPSTLSSTAAIMTSANTKTSSRERPSIDLADPRESLASGAPNQSRPPTDWKNASANSIPDSHSSRTNWSPSFPVAPGVTVMSVHSRAQRFEVLSNGTLVIQNVQLQDRGTYICRFFARLLHGRLLTTLEVWTRPPRMQLASYREATIHQGGEVHLECQADGVPAPLLSWVLPDRSVMTSAGPSTSRISVDTNGTLHISVTLPSDRGVYRCVASNSAGAASTSVRVHVSSLPPVIQQPREEHLLLSPGRPVYAHCSARGAPPPTLRWRIPDGTLVRPSQFLHGNLFVLTNGTLHIRKVGPKDSGSYECTASNAMGTDKRTVNKARIISTSPSSSTVLQGGILQLHCSVTGNPTPIIIWRTPSRKLVDQHFSFDRRLKVHPNGTLSVQAVTEKDAGDYLCIARNKVADDYRLLHVTVAAKPATIEPKQLLTQMVSVGKPLKVDCQASGLPDPAVHWTLPDGTMVNSVLHGEDRGGREQRLTVFSNGTLLVPAVSAGEGGEYTCYAENQGGHDTMKVRQVMMTSVPTFTDDRSYHVMKVRQGATARIPCRATGNPTPTVTWFNPANRVIPRSLGSGYYFERVVVVSNGTLEVRVAQKIDTGNYTCQASNSAGERNNTGININRPSIIHNGNTTTVKQQAVKGQTIFLPCPSQNSRQSRLFWLLPGNGMLPSPYYGSRLTVHRNGTLELRGVRGSDAGVLVCVVRSEKGETTMRVELEVSDRQEEVRSPHREERVGLTKVPLSGGLVESEQSLSSKPASPVLYPRISVTEKPRQSAVRLPAPPHPVGAPSSTGTASVPTVITRTASLVSIINGETLHLPCPASQTPGFTRSSFTWTMPSGKVLSQGESGDSGRYLIQEDGALTVQQASVFDRGTYTCRSTSYDSSSVSVITVPVIVIAYPPRITTGPSPVTYTRPGVAVELPCLTIATPRATVTWETPDLMQLKVMAQPRIYGNRYLSPQGSLVIQNPTSMDTGFYKCTAKNVIGVDTKATYLHVI
uniref:Ig-like domain-containing protein n=1 Tax=Oreochromis niloticus TaxID=8128 RepID=I3J8M9_ORENI